MKDTTRLKIAAIEAAQTKSKHRITLAEAEAEQKRQEMARKRKLKKRPGLKSYGLEWLTGFQRSVWLAFTDIRKHGLARTWLTKRIKLPRETI